MTEQIKIISKEIDENKREKLLEMGGKEWKDSNLEEVNNDVFERTIKKHRIYFNDRNDLLEAANVDAYGQDFYYDLFENTWAGDICGYEIAKMNDYYKF